MVCTMPIVPRRLSKMIVNMAETLRPLLDCHEWQKKPLS